ncbi:MAG: phosphate signaling complex protein PhoU [Deltaproteobacteria bacterium]|jgi:phosphate transport system protein|nr:phosphate signaling complex protein PhoU [Deltaproteobacteria bacterium]
MAIQDKDLLAIRSRLAVMGQLSAGMFSGAVEALERADGRLARTVIGHDAQVDALENEIEGLCLRFLALKAPKALELRYAVAVTRLTTDIERVADHATVMAREGLARHLAPIWARDRGFGEMASIAHGMVGQAIDSFLAGDDRIHADIVARDRRVGELHRGLNEGLAAQVARDPDRALDIVSLINLTRRMERVADHAKNISVMVPYVTKGILLRHNPEAGPDADNDD